MRKLNRSKLLGLVTAGAIVVTTAFSFAAWDTLEATTEKATVSIDQPVVVKASTLSMNPGTKSTTEDTLTYTGQVSFDLEAADGLTFETTPTLTKPNGDSIASGNGVTVTAEVNTTSSTAVKKVVDVTVKFDHSDVSFDKTLLGTNADVVVKGELTAP